MTGKPFFLVMSNATSSDSEPEVEIVGGPPTIRFENVLGLTNTFILRQSVKLYYSRHKGLVNK